jgi:FkbM family methyltransferase
MTRGFKEFAKLLATRSRHVAALYRAYRYFKESFALREAPKDTPLGFKLVGNVSMQRGDFEKEETEVVGRVLRYADVFINVGANIGYYCCLALASGKKVVAFEPIDLNLKYLLKNILANGGGSNIEIFPLALSNRTGVIEIYGSGTGASLLKGWAGAPGQFVSLAPTSTMDTVLGSRFEGTKCFILVDIEGAEKSMLEGATMLLSANPRPVWMVEICVSQHQPRGIKINPHLLTTFQLFWSSGYEAWTVARPGRLVESTEVESIARGGDDTLLTPNFLFIEKGKRARVLSHD